MKREDKQWGYLRGRTPQVVWTRHENRYSQDIPDLSYAYAGVNGWVELKIVPELTRAGVLRIPHLTAGQVLWLERVGKSGSGHAFLLLALGEQPAKAQWFIFPWFHVRAIFDAKVTESTIDEYSIRTGVSGLVTANLLEVLSVDFSQFLYQSHMQK